MAYMVTSQESRSSESGAEVRLGAAESMLLARPKVTVIICTCNRADSLRATLMSLKDVEIPADLAAELLVVDNGSTDHTAVVVRNCGFGNMPVRYVHEPRRGKGFAYNSGMGAARGDILLFTDDDVRVPQTWMEAMCRPIAEGVVDVVAGHVRLAPSLERPWMTALHRACLAETGPFIDRREIVGANMAFSRNVLMDVPAFDVELGPGALGLHDETLFCLQLLKAGYRKTSVAAGGEVEHHPDQDRLRYDAFVNDAEKRGKSGAYVRHHWHHHRIACPRLRMLKAYATLVSVRLLSHWRWRYGEGIHPAEYGAIRAISFYRYLAHIRSMPRNYEREGLIKKNQHTGEIRQPQEGAPGAACWMQDRKFVTAQQAGRP